MFKSVFVIAISAIAFGATVGSAVAKTEQLTSQERSEMRQRAERLLAERDRGAMPVHSTEAKSSRSKKAQH